MIEHILTSILAACIAALIKVTYDAGKSLNALLKEHGERLATLETEVKEVKKNAIYITHESSH